MLNNIRMHVCIVLYMSNSGIHVRSTSDFQWDKNILEIKFPEKNQRNFSYLTKKGYGSK